MQNWTLEPTGLAKPGKTHGLTGTVSGLACQDSAGRVSVRMRNRIDPLLVAKPMPLAGHPVPLLTLGSNIVCSILAHRGRLCIDHGPTAMRSALSVHDPRPTIVVIPLTLIFRWW